MVNLPLADNRTISNITSTNTCQYQLCRATIMVSMQGCLWLLARSDFANITSWEGPRECVVKQTFLQSNFPNHEPIVRNLETPKTFTPFNTVESTSSQFPSDVSPVQTTKRGMFWWSLRCKWGAVGTRNLYYACVGKYGPISKYNTKYFMMTYSQCSHNRKIPPHKIPIKSLKTPITPYPFYPALAPDARQRLHDLAVPESGMQRCNQRWVVVR